MGEKGPFLRKIRYENSSSPVIFVLRRSCTFYPVKLLVWILNYVHKQWFCTKIDIHDFFTLSTFWNAWLCVSIEKAVKAENRLIDQKSKVVPNDPQMVWEHFGGVFSVFSTFFGWIYPLFRVKNAYFATILVDLSRFILKSRLKKKIANIDFCGRQLSEITV